jgi:hypothetical protein
MRKCRTGPCAARRQYSPHQPNESAHARPRLHADPERHPHRRDRAGRKAQPRHPRPGQSHRGGRPGRGQAAGEPGHQGAHAHPGCCRKVHHARPHRRTRSHLVAPGRRPGHALYLHPGLCRAVDRAGDRPRAAGGGDQHFGAGGEVVRRRDDPRRHQRRHDRRAAHLLRRPGAHADRGHLRQHQPLHRQDRGRQRRHPVQLGGRLSPGDPPPVQARRRHDQGGRFLLGRHADRAARGTAGRGRRSAPPQPQGEYPFSRLGLDADLRRSGRGLDLPRRPGHRGRSRRGGQGGHPDHARLRADADHRGRRGDAGFQRRDAQARARPAGNQLRVDPQGARPRYPDPGRHRLRQRRRLRARPLPRPRGGDPGQGNRHDADGSHPGLHPRQRTGGRPGRPGRHDRARQAGRHHRLGGQPARRHQGAAAAAAPGLRHEGRTTRSPTRASASDPWRSNPSATRSTRRAERAFLFPPLQA